ncbi:SatD family protein [Streptococcus equi]|uniref:SatD family protein n=1 Tax=Streptococcus equi TaxID=1336 RepID=UPI001E54300C|nr:SatD family protein [Streptococcus equi]MCD3442106.1 SatD family protein [Streptococcus equi subsp. zooepidemicus]HEL0676790.1 DNA-binding protein [Streptococcus equi subsp. zooepidemicus]
MLYIAVIGDLIHSKQIQSRSLVQESLKACLEQLNHDFSPYIVSNLSVTLGDEFQGLLTNDAPVFQLIDLINQAMTGYPVRFGIGQGTILTDINPDISIGADGPAYWRAREAIHYIHQKNDYGNTQVAIRTDKEQKDLVLNSLLAAGEAIKASWRASQLEVFHALLDLGIYEEQFDQQLIGDTLDLQSSALSKRLKSSSVKVYLRSRHAALTYLQE